MKCLPDSTPKAAGTLLAAGYRPPSLGRSLRVTFAGLRLRPFSPRAGQVWCDPPDPPAFFFRL